MLFSWFLELGLLFIYVLCMTLYHFFFVFFNFAYVRRGHDYVEVYIGPGDHFTVDVGNVKHNDFG